MSAPTIHVAAHAIAPGPRVGLANRRRDSRRIPRKSAQVLCLKGSLGLGANLALALLDLSATGVRLLVRSPLEKGQEIEVVLTLPGMAWSRRKLARVAWVQQQDDGTCCVGAEFQSRLSYADFQVLVPGDR